MQKLNNFLNFVFPGFSEDSFQKEFDKEFDYEPSSSILSILDCMLSFMGILKLNYFLYMLRSKSVVLGIQQLTCKYS